MRTPPYVAISIATVPIPASEDGRHPADEQLVAIGLMIGTMLKDQWRFYRCAEAIGAGEYDDRLLDWLAEELPADAIVIGWKLASHLMPVLIEAASTARASIAHACMARLTEAMRVGTVDLSLDHGGSSAPPLVEVAADMTIATALTTPDERISTWAGGDTWRLRLDAVDDALAIWRMFVRLSGTLGLNAEDATDEWARRRKRLQAVP